MQTTTLNQNLLFDFLPMSPTILFVAGLAICSAMLSGLLFVFSNFAMRAFSRLPAEAGVSAMQSINATILNPGFFGLFLGTGTGSLLALVVSLVHWPHPASAWVAAGATLLLAGLFVVTAAINVPLNKQLDTVDPADPAAAASWQDYVSHWQPWNHIRTAACLLAAACYTIGALQMT